MLSLFRRHLILTVFTALAILLVLIGWWVRPDMSPTPDEVRDSAPEQESVPQSSPETLIGDITERNQEELDSTNCADIYEQQIDEFFRTVSEEDADEIIAFALQNAENASSSGHVVMASHIVDSAQDRVTLLQEGIDANPGSAHLVWTAVSACVRANDTAECPELDRWIERLLALDGENALAWALAGHAYLTQGREDEALEAFRRGAISYTANNYHVADVEAALTAVNSLGGYSEILAYTVSVGHAAAFAQPLSYFYVCKDKIDTGTQWAEACLALGKTIESTATDFLSQSLGRRIQWQSRVSRGEDAESPELKELKDADLTAGLENEALRYPDSPRIFVEALRNSGEISAFETLLAVNERRMAEGYTVDCGDIRY